MPSPEDKPVVCMRPRRFFNGEPRDDGRDVLSLG
jgi:hypothetical protein